MRFEGLLDGFVADELHHVRHAGRVAHCAGERIGFERPPFEAGGPIEAVADCGITDEEVEIGFVAAAQERGFSIGVDGEAGHDQCDPMLFAGEVLECIAKLVDFVALILRGFRRLSPTVRCRRSR